MNKYKKISIILSIIALLIIIFLGLNIDIRDKKIRKQQVEIDSLEETIYRMEMEGEKYGFR